MSGDREQFAIRRPRSALAPVWSYGVRVGYQEGKVSPPRLVSVLVERTWKPGQLLGWRVWPGACRFLVRLVTRAPKGDSEATWVDASRVRPRRSPHEEA